MDTIHDVLHQSHLLDLGPLPAPRLEPVATMQQALQFLVRGRRGAIVAVREMTPVGIFTERDVVTRLPAELFTSKEARRTTPLEQVMSRPPVTVRRQASLAEAVEIMAERRHRHLVVIDRDGKLKGLLTTADIVQFLTDQFPEETVNLPPHLNQRYRTPGGA